MNLPKKHGSKRGLCHSIALIGFLALAATASHAEPNPTLVFLGLEALAADILDRAAGVPDGAPSVLEGMEPRIVAWRSGSDFVAALDENRSGGDPDEQDDLYLVDYESDGDFDRLVDWEDVDGDGRADRQTLLALTEGGPEANRLSGFFIEQRDQARDFWYLSRWSYVQSESQFLCDFSGDLFFSAIHVDRRRTGWEAFDESFFGFFDPDGDGWSEEALRVAGAGVHVGAIRWSFDLDNDGGARAGDRSGATDSEATDDPANAAHSEATDDRASAADSEASDDRSSALDSEAPADRPATGTSEATCADSTMRIPYDYDLSISTDGRLLLNAAVMETVMVRGKKLPLLRWSEARSWAGAQNWRRALLTVDENDANHDPGDPKKRERWEGVIAEDPGGFPFSGGPSCGQLGKRYEIRTEKGPVELYYSEVDGRIHLRGAHLGWLDLDLDADAVRDARLELQDANTDGFFDTWKWDANADGVYEATYTAPDSRAQSLALDGEALRSIEGRIRERAGGRSQRERFEQDVSQWAKAGRFVPRTE